MRQWTVDAFASRPFEGNPACVVEPFDDWPADAWMQALAQENAQAETAFLRRTADPATFELRWFTPAVEVKLCGHATLASAHVLLEELRVEGPGLTFRTRLSGDLHVRREEGLYEMDFPADPPHPTASPDGLGAALGVEPLEVWAGGYHVALLPTADDVRTLKPKLGPDDPPTLVVAALSDDPAYDVVDRFFAPSLGVAEDPATGSAHCILAPLFSERLGKPVLRFRQAFPGRGADIETELKGDRVLLRGRAVTVVESRLRL